MSITQLMLLTGDLLVARDKYLTQHSLRFDGTGDYLEWTPTVARGSNWTFSVWFKRASTGTSTVWHPFLEADNGANSDTISIYNDELYIGHASGTSSATIADSFADTEWHHLVVSWSSGQSTVGDALKIYLDGNPKAISGYLFTKLISPSTVLNFGSNVQNVIGGRSSGVAYWFDGQMAEVHFVDGTAYDASYFGETRDGVWLPKEVTDVTYGNNGFYLNFAGNDTGVTLLLDGSGLTDDLSNAENDLSAYNNTTVTGGGAVTLGTTDGTTVAHPYGSTAVPYLDFPEEDGLAIPTTFDLSGGDWTFECWVYFNKISQFQSIFSSAVNNVGIQFSLAPSPNQNKFRFDLSGQTPLETTTSLSQDTWYHAALTYVDSSQTLTIYVDGSNAGSSSSSLWSTITDQYLGGPNQDTSVSNNGHILVLGVNRSNGYPLDGKLTDVRFTRGIARDIAAEWTNGSYTSALTNTPEYLGDFGVDRSTDGTGVTLLLDGDGTNGQTTFTDKSSVQHTVTAYGDAQVDTSVKKFGTGSMKFDGSGDYLTLPSNFAPQLGTGDFTVECWLNASNTSGNTVIFDCREESGNPSGWLLGLNGDSLVHLKNGGALNLTTATSAVTSSTWHHVALVRSSNTTTLFVDGSSVGTVDVTGKSYDFGNPLTIGAVSYSGSSYGDFAGNLDDIRITKGYARYTNTFTPPTAALTNDDTWDKPKNNFSVEGNITPDDQLLDTPNLRFATLDPASKGTYAILSEGNLKITNNNSSWGSAKTDFAIPAGDKVYFEAMMNSLYGMFGVTKSDSAKNSYLGLVSDGWALYPLTTKNELFHDTDNTVQWGTSTSGGPSNRIFMCAVDRSTGEMFFGADGNWFTGDETEVSSFADARAAFGPADALPGFTDADLSSGSLFPAVSVNDPGGTPPSGILNFGQDHTFAGAKGPLLTPYSDANGVGEFYYEPPSGFMALAQKYS